MSPPARDVTALADERGPASSTSESRAYKGQRGGADLHAGRRAGGGLKDEHEAWIAVLTDWLGRQ